MWNIIVFTVVIYAAAITCSAITVKATLDDGGAARVFPADFKFGAATAAYQIEGAWNVSDKGVSIWDHLTHTQPWRVQEGENGDVAVDSYHQYLRDVEMLKEISLDLYRFSISWTRILPTGYSNVLSEDGIQYYNNLIDALLANGIEPVVTIYHFDLPQSLQDLGGWANPFVQDWFADYARVAFEKFGDRVKTWITFNEAQMICEYGYGAEMAAPALNAHGVGNYLCTYNVLKAHAKAYHIYDEEFRPTQLGKIGYTTATSWYEPLTDSSEDIQAAEDARLFYYGIYTHPIYAAEGDYPARVKEVIAAKSLEQGFARSRLPELTPEEVEYIKGTADFYGMNHYTTSLVYRNESVDGIYSIPSLSDDMNVGETQDPDWPQSAISWLNTVPWGIRSALNDIKIRYNNVEIMITENGYASAAELEDWGRISYYRQYLAEVLNAILEDNVNVTAYTAWSLMDNFEWLQGFTQRMGLYETDYENTNRTRTPRLSAAVYAEVIRSRIVDFDYIPDPIMD